MNISELLSQDIEPQCRCRDVRDNNVYFYTDIENDDIPEQFYGLQKELAKAAFKIVFIDCDTWQNEL